MSDLEKEVFIKLVSKIDQTFEDEFKAEYNSPELIWEFLKQQEFKINFDYSEAFNHGFNTCLENVKQQVIKGKIEVLEECKSDIDNWSPAKVYMKLCNRIDELKQLETPKI